MYDVFVLRLGLPDTIHAGEDDGGVVSYYDGVLVLRHEAAFIADHGPAVVEGICDGGGGADECFDGYYRILSESALIMFVAVIEQVMRLLMQAPADAMTTKVLYHFISSSPGLGLYEVADIGNAYTAFDIADRFLQNGSGSIYQVLMLMRVCAQHEGAAVIRPVAIQLS